MIRVRLTKQARTDIRELIDYIAKRNLTAARQYISILHQSISSLGENAYLGRAREELGDGVRSLPSQSHIVFYTIVRDEIHVLRVLHSARDIDAVFGRLPGA